MYAIVDDVESIDIFALKIGNAHFISEEGSLSTDITFNYQVSIPIDREKLVKAKLETLNVYLTNSSTITDFSNETLGQPSITCIANFNGNSSLVVSALENMVGAEMLATLQLEAQNKFFILNVDHRSLFNVERYKDYFVDSSVGLGTSVGAAHQFVTSLVKDSNGEDVVVNQEQFGYNFDNELARQAKSLKRVVYNKAYKQAKGLINIFNYDKIKREDRPSDARNLVDPGEINPAFLNQISYYTRSNFLEKTTKVSSNAANNLAVVSFIVPIKLSQLSQAGISSLNNFSLLIEATQRETLNLGDAVVDRALIPISLNQDRSDQHLTMEDFDINGSHDTNGNVCFDFNIACNKDSIINFDVHYKYLSKSKPIHLSKFNKIRTVNFDASSGKSNGFKLAPSERFASNTTQNDYYVPPTLHVPQFLRITPTISNESFDNCVEIGIPPKTEYINTCFPMYVTIRNNTPPAPSSMHLVVQTTPLTEFTKLRPVKRMVSHAPFADSKEFKVRPVGPPSTNAFMSENQRFESTALLLANQDISKSENTKLLPAFHDFSTVTEVKTIEFPDINLEESDVYEYRVQLERSIDKVGDIYSSTNFIEQYLQIPDFITISSSFAANTIQNNVYINVSTRLNSTSMTDMEKVFRSMLGDVFDLFSSDLAEVRQNLGITTIIGVTRIEIDTGNVLDLGFFNQRNISNLAQASSDFTIYDNKPMNKSYSYLYKISTFAAPILNLIQAARESTRERSVGLGSNAKHKLLETSHRSSASTRQMFAEIARDENLISQVRSKLRTPADVLHGIIRDEKDIDVFKDAATGDVSYLTLRNNTAITEFSPGIVSFNQSGVNIRSSIFKSNNTQRGTQEVKTKLIFSIPVQFSSQIDHAVIFSVKNDKLEHCCNLHVQDLKINYKAFIQLTNFKGTCEFKLFPVNVFGEIMQPINIGQYTQV